MPKLFNTLRLSSQFVWMIIVFRSLFVRQVLWWLEKYSTKCFDCPVCLEIILQWKLAFNRVLIFNDCVLHNISCDSSEDQIPDSSESGFSRSYLFVLKLKKFRLQKWLALSRNVSVQQQFGNPENPDVQCWRRVRPGLGWVSSETPDWTLPSSQRQPWSSQQHEQSAEEVKAIK